MYATRVSKRFAASDDASALAAYLREISKLSRLTADEERALGARIRHDADQAAVTRAVRETHAAWRRGEPALRADSTLVADFDRRRLAGRFAALFNRRSSPKAGPIASWEQHSTQQC